MKKTFQVENLDCAHCAGLIEEKVRKIPGVQDANLNFMTLKLNVEAEEESFPEIMKKIKKAAGKIEPDCRIIF